MNTTKIIYNGNIYDIYENDNWVLSRSSSRNVLSYLTEISGTKPIKIIFEDKTIQK